MDLLVACTGIALFLSPLEPVRSTIPEAAPVVQTVGFTEAVFPTGILNTILADRNCVSVRFYNVITPANAAGSLMVIGVKADGTELNGGLFAAPYKANTPNAQDPSAITGLSRSNAVEACAAMARSGATSFSTSMDKAALQGVMGFQGCTAVRLRSATGGGVLKVEPVKIEGGRVLELDPAGGAARMTSDPCPAACGLRSNYVNEAQLPR